MNTMSPPNSERTPTRMQEGRMAKRRLRPSRESRTPISEGSHCVTPTPSRSKIHKRNMRGETPLHIACIKGNMTAVTNLLDQGAHIDAKDNAGWTPLHEACNHGHVNVVSVLIDNGVNVNVPAGMGGVTPLHDAVNNNHIEVVKLLLSKGADPKLKNARKLTPLDICREDSIRILLKKALSDSYMESEDVFAETLLPLANSSLGRFHGQRKHVNFRENRDMSSIPSPNPMSPHSTCCFKHQDGSLCDNDVTKGERLCDNHKAAPDKLKLMLGLSPTTRLSLLSDSSPSKKRKNREPIRITSRTGAMPTSGGSSHSIKSLSSSNSKSPKKRKKTKLTRYTKGKSDVMFNAVTTSKDETHMSSIPSPNPMSPHSTCCFKHQDGSLCDNDVTEGERLCDNHKAAPDKLKLMLGLSPTTRLSLLSDSSPSKKRKNREPIRITSQTGAMPTSGGSSHSIKSLSSSNSKSSKKRNAPKTTPSSATPSKPSDVSDVKYSNDSKLIPCDSNTNSNPLSTKPLPDSTSNTTTNPPPSSTVITTSEQTNLSLSVTESLPQPMEISELPHPQESHSASPDGQPHPHDDLIIKSVTPALLKDELEQLNKREESVQTALVESETSLTHVNTEIEAIQKTLQDLVITKKQLITKCDELTREFQEVLSLKQSLLLSKFTAKYN